MFRAASFAALLCIPTSLAAADITWSRAVDTTDSAQLIPGRVVFAVNGGRDVTITNAGPSGTLRYDFDGLAYDALDTTPPVSSRTYFNSGGRTNVNDANFNALLGSFTWTTSGTRALTHTIDGLEPGKTYQVQLFYNDQRAKYANRTMIYGDTAVSAVGAGWGQHVIGRFIADASTQKIAHRTTSANNVHLTAMLVTEVETSTTAAFNGDTITRTRDFRIYLSFAEPVTGLTTRSLIVQGATVRNLTGSGRHYTVSLRATGTDDIRVDLPFGAALSLETGGPSGAAPTFTIENAIPAGEVITIDTQQSWKAATRNTKGVTLRKGTVIPDSASSVFRSEVLPLDGLRQVTSLTLTQVPDWENWHEAGNLGPADAGDAPVLLPVAEGQYYLLGLGQSGGYHAWFSADMKTWIERGPVTPPGDGRWVTSAEMKDGRFYIYSDVPNDQNPTLFIDGNLDDGIPGTPAGAVLVKDACGSDAGFIRNDTDGLFHAIYEDWTPINARRNSWDSPLAGHASSKDGITGFAYDEHPPAVDMRSDPTGVSTAFNHPFIGTCSYDVHSAEQDAFGDWSVIKVGDQFHLFGDYDQHDGGISVGRLTSRSLFEPFEFIGQLGSGHPDPTIGFAEGQFYLITQRNTDFTSPGPWVDGVEARAGVDTNGDGTTDQWTAWTRLSESYGQKPGYARVVEVTPAALDLSSLPKARGVQFQIRMQGGSAIVPKIDRVDIRYD